jgi:hypothetical protein
VHDSEAVKKVTHAVKLLQFHTDYRPPYYGTWRKKPTLSARNPFRKIEVCMMNKKGLECVSALSFCNYSRIHFSAFCYIYLHVPSHLVVVQKLNINECSMTLVWSG